MNVGMLSERSFYRIQRDSLIPAINAVYNKQSADILKYITESGVAVDLAGDGRCDSPGFNAGLQRKVLTNDRNDEIVDFFIARVGNTTKTYLLEFCKNNDIDINILTTDQHTQIRKFMREKYPSILHQFDVWHRAKHLRKKLTKVAMKKENVLLQSWVKSIVQHFWWSCETCN